jgi:hypothetical protein
MAHAMTKSLIALATLTAGLAGPAMAQSTAGVFEAGELRFGALPSQDLQAGHCGLFLWTGIERPVFLFFGSDDPARATVRLKGRDRQLKRTSVSGERIYGHFERQTFEGQGLTFAVNLTFDAERSLPDGAVVQKGSITVRDKGGTETIIPVAGMVGCKSA